MNNLKLIQLLKSILFALFLFFTTKIFFIFNNSEYLQNLSFTEYLFPLFYGLRFDISVVLIGNFLYISFAILNVFRSRVYDYFLRILFVVSNGLIIFFNIVDSEFFIFYGKKLTADVFLISTDIKSQSLQILGNYWGYVLLIFIYFFLLFFLYPKRVISLKFVKKYSLIKVLGLYLFTIIFSFVLIRGGLQMRSISPKDAFVFKQVEQGNIALPGVYSLIRSVGKKKLPQVNYFSNKKEYFDIIQNYKKSNRSLLTLPKDTNVVLIIVESLSTEYINAGYAPFVSELLKKSASTSYTFSNGRRSIEVLPSLLVGFPSVLDRPLYQSQFQTNYFKSLPTAFNLKGYRTSFFHGGKNGTMDFDSYVKSIGVNEYYGLDEYPNKDHFDGHWGIYDHYYFDYFLKTLNDMPLPFFSTIFTLSSHQPYSIPSDFKNTFNKGTLEIHESIGYVDRSLKDFFLKAENSSWFENTLFIITADHTQKLESSYFNSLEGRYRVPILFFHPAINLKDYIRGDFSQHVDLPATLNGLLDLDLDTLNFGRNLFSEGESFVFNKSGSTYFVRTEDGVTSMKIGDDTAVGHDKALVKALIQYTFDGLKTNSFYK